MALSTLMQCAEQCACFSKKKQKKKQSPLEKTTLMCIIAQQEQKTGPNGFVKI